MTNATPPAPRPLRPEWLKQREASERKWDELSRLSEEDLREILDWAREQLANLFQLQDLGLGPNDPQFSHELDKLYDTIRNAMTRQDLILGFLLIVQAEAQQLAKERMKAWEHELSRITDPDVF